jgi:hypothetical protein
LTIAPEQALLGAIDRSLSNWCRILTAREQPPLETVVTLAAVLGLSAADLCR